MPEDSMGTERFEGQTPSFEQSQVDQAVVKARARDPERYRVSGGAFSPKLPGEMQPAVLPPDSPEERERREKQRRQEGLLVGLAEKLLRTRNPEAIIWHTRRTLAAIESAADKPELQWADTPRLVLVERAAKCEDSLKDPEFAKTLGYDDEGLVEKTVVRDMLKPDGLEGFEMELTGEEAAMIRAAAERYKFGESAYPYDEDGRQKVSLSQEQARILKRNSDIRKILKKKETITIPPGYSTKELKAIAETARNLEKEISVRMKIAVAYYLYKFSEPPGFAVLNALASLGSRYSGINTEEWKFLFSLDKTKEGEMTFGNKIDTAMRLYTLIALGKKENLKLTDEEKRGLTEEQIEEKEKEEKGNMKIQRREKIIEVLRKQPGSLAGRADGPVFVDQLVEFAGKNIFCKRISGKGQTLVVQKIRDFVKETIGGDESDTKAAEELGWRIFFMWGIAAHFDHREGEGPSGPPNSDVTARIQHFEAFRKKQAKKGIEHGPDATLGKYPESLISSFLHSTLYNNSGNNQLLRNVGSLWDDWWRGGKRLGDEKFHWDEVGADAWFGYNFTLLNIGKKEKGLFDMAMSPLPAQKLIDVEVLRELKNTVDLATHQISVFDGDLAGWLERMKGRKDAKGKLYTDYTVGDAKGLLNAQKKQTRELILLGALTAAYQANNQAYQEWGSWVPGSLAGVDKGKYQTQEKKILRNLVQSGFLIDPDDLKNRRIPSHEASEEDWNRIVDEAYAFLKGRGLVA